MGKKKEFSPLPPCIRAGRFEAGCDEAGRGCLAGPVVAAAVILPDDFIHPLINDSKQLTERQREELAEIIRVNALAWSVGIVDNQEIDSINILRASILAMHRALDGLGRKPGAIAVDGNRFTPWRDIEWQTVVRGDGKYANIAAASILAKTHRDHLMHGYARTYPGYGWEKNKGYPTKTHRQAIEKLGPTPLHRMTFRLIDTQLRLF